MKLIKIEDYDTQDCWDIEVEDTHCFYANGVLVHNSNAGVAMDKDGKMWFQSRTNIITPEKDNAGFAFFANTHKEIFKKFINDIRDSAKDIVDDTVIIFGEWCGGSIQKGVAINGLDKMFVIFDVKIVTPDDEESNYYLPSEYWKDFKDPDNHIYNIEDFQSFDLTIDFSKLHEAQAKLIELTEQVEKECPVGKAFVNEAIEGVKNVEISLDTLPKLGLPDKIKDEVRKVLKNMESGTSITLSL